MLLRIYHQPHGQRDREECYYIDFDGIPTGEEYKRLEWLIREPLGIVGGTSAFKDADVVEIGPLLSRVTAFSTNAVSIVKGMGLRVKRIEKSVRYLIGGKTPEEIKDKHLDQMTQEVYTTRLLSWGTQAEPEPVRVIPVLEEGRSALETINKELGLGIDDDDLDYYHAYFRDVLKRNPTDVEMCRIGIGNSEHCRHPLWRGPQTIDGNEMPESLMDIAKDPLKHNPGNSRLAFNDNSGALGAQSVLHFVSSSPGTPAMLVYKRRLLSSTATAETHNHPTFISAFEGAATGVGGRERDSVAVGRTGYIRAGVAGYSVADLSWKAPRRYESPLGILIKGSNGASDYHNKFGEPLIGGFATSFDLRIDGKRRAYVKPILYSGAIGVVEEENLFKRKPEVGMLLVRIGGPAYRVGVGGGSASSMQSGDNDAGLDFKSVQRGDPQMGNRAYRALRSLAEMGEDNPIESIHDQGAGGIANLFTELMELLGGRIDIRKIVVGDRTMSVLEIDIGEYQEGYGLLVRRENVEVVKAACVREEANCEVLGEITGDGIVVVEDSANGTTPVNLPLKGVLTDLPPKRFSWKRPNIDLPPFVIPPGKTAGELLRLVFGSVQVASKGYLVHKADRSVTGLVRQQQCVGPFQVPVGNAGVMAHSYRGYSGTAKALSVQQALMLFAPAAGARMAVANALIKLASAGISSVADAKFRVNWMWPAKLNGELALIYEAASAGRDIMIELGTAGDGGKDSSSMAAKLLEELVLAPGSLALLAYAPVPDFRKVVTPELRGDGMLGLIDLGQGKNRLGGSVLAQMFGELGNEAPDIDDVPLLRRSLASILRLVKAGLLTAYHKRSGGGLATTLAEMCMAGNCGAHVRLADENTMPVLFSQEAGMVFECRSQDVDRVNQMLQENDVPVTWLGTTSKRNRRLRVQARRRGEVVLSESISELRQAWEALSMQHSLRESTPETLQQEEASFADEREPVYRRTFTPQKTQRRRKKPRVAILREQGTNGDREMAAAFTEAGFEAFDIAMNDLRAGTVTSFDRFQVAVPTGGFSFADAFGSGKGWAGGIRYNPRLMAIFEEFFNRPDTLSLGVCNGAQVHPYLGEIPWRGIPENSQPRFVENTSGIFESRWAAVKILPSPAGGTWFTEMEGSILGIHVAHKEGRLLFPDPLVAEEVRRQQLAPLVFVGPDGEPTEAYPYNPNGSPNGQTALCSRDGRHLAMMPHSERCFLPWQSHYLPRDWQADEVGSWLRMFQNSRDWCLEHS